MLTRRSLDLHTPELQNTYAYFQPPGIDHRSEVVVIPVGPRRGMVELINTVLEDQRAFFEHHRWAKFWMWTEINQRMYARFRVLDFDGLSSTPDPEEHAGREPVFLKLWGNQEPS